MTKCNTTLLKAAVASAMLALSAGAMAQTGPAINSDDRGIRTPQSAPEQPVVPARIPGGQPAISTTNTPMSPSESKSSIPTAEAFRPAPRANNPNLPNPVTPSAANESAPQPVVVEPTNKTGMEGRGAAAADMQRRGAMDSGARLPGSTVGDGMTRVPPVGSGVSTMPSRNNPASVSESAPQRTGKEVSSPPVADSRNMPNPKTPANVSESAPDKTGKEQLGVGATR